jgi:hypothetical protein
MVQNKLFLHKVARSQGSKVKDVIDMVTGDDTLAPEDTLAPKDALAPKNDDNTVTKVALCILR